MTQRDAEIDALVSSLRDHGWHTAATALLQYAERVAELERDIERAQSHCSAAILDYNESKEREQRLRDALRELDESHMAQEAVWNDDAFDAREESWQNRMADAETRLDEAFSAARAALAEDV